MSGVAQNLSIEPFASALAVGSVSVEGRAILAPLSGVTDVGMRRAAQEFGAALVVTEMVASDAYLAADEEARIRSDGTGLAPHVVQIVGRSPHRMADAARLAAASGADIIDINMGCPAKRVVGGLAGSALMREPVLAVGIVAAVRSSVDVPVTVKMRLGWDSTALNGPELARRFEAEGVAMITVHGRTRAQFYKGQADWHAIRAVRDALRIPLIANGDCRSIADARAMLAASGADGVMIGRAAIGRPWLVGEISVALAGGRRPPPTAEQRRDAARRHYASLLSQMGIAPGVRHARKHLVAYAAAAVEDGFDVSDHSRRVLSTTDDYHEVERVLDQLWELPPMQSAA